MRIRNNKLKIILFGVKNFGKKQKFEGTTKSKDSILKAYTTIHTEQMTGYIVKNVAEAS